MKQENPLGADRRLPPIEVGAGDIMVTRLRALAHPSRLAIIRQLAERDRCCCSDFCNCLGLAQSTISQHLELLREAGLVTRHADGTRSVFYLERQRFKELANAIALIADGEGSCDDTRKIRK